MAMSRMIAILTRRSFSQGRPVAPHSAAPGGRKVIGLWFSRLYGSVASGDGMLDLKSGESLQGQLRDVELRITNFSKEDKGTSILAGDIFDVPIRQDIVHRVVRWQRAKKRQGRHSTKTISEVSGTGRKPFPQKGSGQARHGTLRGPQFRHGATVHGPKPRSYAYKLQKKVRRLGLKIALSARVAENKLILFDNMKPPSHKTKEMAKLLAEGFAQSRKILLVDGGEEIDRDLRLSTQNLHYADVLPAKGLNVYSILLHDTLVMTVDAVKYIENRLHTPINR